MKIDINKMDLTLARQRRSMHELRGDGLSPKTLTKIRRGEDIRPKAVGALAAALGVDPAELLKEE